MRLETYGYEGFSTVTTIVISTFVREWHSWEKGKCILVKRKGERKKEKKKEKERIANKKQRQNEI